MITHEVVKLLHSMERANIVGEDVSVASEEPKGLRAHLETLHVLVGALLYRPYEMPAIHLISFQGACQAFREMPAFHQKTKV